MESLRRTLVLREHIPSEKELLDILSKKSGRGWISNFLRECMRSGYVALERELAKVPDHNDATAIKDVLQEAFPSFQGYNYPIVRDYICARNAVFGDPLANSDLGVASVAGVSQSEEVAIAPPAKAVVDEEKKPPTKHEWGHLRNLAGLGEGDKQ